MSDWEELAKLARGEDKDSILRLLNAMDDVDFGMEVKSLSKKLNIGTTDLRNMRKATKKQPEPNEDESIVEELEPWETTVCGLDIAVEILESFNRHVVLRPYYPEAITLWIMASYIDERFYIFPHLNITAPDRECGKSVALDTVGQYCRKALETENISPAAIFRVIDAYRPTLLIDECDTFLDAIPDARGILNSAHKRGGAVVRSVGDDHMPKKFLTYTAIVIAGIGRIAETTRSRSIVVPLSRMAGDERIELRNRRTDAAAALVRSKLLTWKLQVEDGIDDPAMLVPEVQSRRLMDNWHPLFIAAEIIGGGWPKWCLDAFNAITEEDDTDESIGAKLLTDIRDIFRWKGKQVHSAELCECLECLDGQPWATYSRGKPITTNALAKLLVPYGIHSVQLRIGTENKRGYSVDQFQEAFFRYLQSVEAPEARASVEYPEDDDCAF